MSTHLFDGYRTPVCVSSIERHPQPGSPFTAYLIGREIGNADSERAAYDVLNYLHRIVRLNGVFANLDADHQFVGIEANHWWKGNFSRFRAFPDKRITTEIAENFLADSTVNAVAAFGITAEPPVYVQAFDDFYAWAVAADQLHSLSAAGGGIEAVAALLDCVSGGVETDAVHLDILLRMVRLQWSGDEWLQQQAALDSLDPAQLLSPLGGIDETLCSRSVELLDVCKARAADFYACSQARVEAFVTKAVRQIRSEGFARAALLVDRSWYGHAAARLAGEGVTVVAVFTTAGSGLALLDRARVLLNAARGSVQLDDLFQGTARQRTRMQALHEEEKDTTDKRCMRWVLAAQGLEQEYQSNLKRSCLEQALICVDRALEVDPANAEAWSSKAYILYSQDPGADWQPCLQQAMDRDPMNELHLLRLGHNLFRQRLRRPAAKAFIRGIYRNPRNGAIWNGLGNALWALDRRKAACLCFDKAGKLGDPLGIRHFETFCSGVRPSPLVVPWTVSWPVVKLMNKLALPLRYRFAQNWHLALQLLLLVTAAATGAVAGVTAAGIWGGLVGGVAYTGAAIALVKCGGRCVEAFSRIGLKKAEQFDDIGEAEKRNRDPLGVSILQSVSKRTKTLIGFPVAIVLVLAGIASAVWADARARDLLIGKAWEEAWSVAVQPLNFILGCLAAWVVLTRLAKLLMSRTGTRRGQSVPLAPVCAYCKKRNSSGLLHLQRHQLLVEPDCFVRYAILPAQRWSEGGEQCTLCHRSDSGAMVATPIGRICARCTGPILDLIARQCTDLSMSSVQQLLDCLLPTRELRTRLAVIKQLDKVRARLKGQFASQEGELLTRLVACLDYKQGHPLDEFVRQAALEAVVGAGQAVLPELLASTRSVSWQLRANALLALGRVAPDDPTVRDALRHAARDERVEVRRHVLRVALDRHADWAHELVRGFDCDPDPEVRAMVASALTLLSDQSLS